jgi:hypothetical protein
MNIGSATSTQAAAQAAQVGQADRLKMQVSVLKKALDGQKETSSELLKMLEPKGKIIDIRV